MLAPRKSEERINTASSHQTGGLEVLRALCCFRFSASGWRRQQLSSAGPQPADATRGVRGIEAGVVRSAMVRL